MAPGAAWQAVQWPDGTIYEGLVKNGVCESYGVVHFGTGDRYEGEFNQGTMNGHGVYVWRDGTIYRGEWTRGLMHGCGVKLWREQGTFQAAAGKYFADEWVGPVMSCDSMAADEAAVEADVAAAMARAFQTEHGRSRRAAAMAARARASPQPDPLQDLPERQQAALKSTVDDIFTREVQRLGGPGSMPTAAGGKTPSHVGSMRPAVRATPSQPQALSWGSPPAADPGRQSPGNPLEGVAHWLQSVFKWGAGDRR